jgi:uncharacterized protein (TIGR02001 family)
VKTLASAVVLALGLATSTGLAADLPVKAAPAAPPPTVSPWDVAFGGAMMNDYIFRGISQSALKPSLYAYSELRYNAAPNWQLYYGNSMESIDFSNHAAAEVDFYGGVRPTFGPLALDVGGWYYWYPDGQNFPGIVPAGTPLGTPNITCTNLFVGFNSACNAAKGDQSFWEVYGKATYTFSDYVALTGDVFYDPSWLNSGAPGTYASGILKLTAPGTWLPSGIGGYLSGEAGYYWLGTTDAFYGNIKLPSYATWNVGIGFTWKVFTVDLRYSDTNLSKANCNVLTGDQNPTLSSGNISAVNPSGFGSAWCGAAFIAKFSADLTVASNLK